MVNVLDRVRHLQVTNPTVPSIHLGDMREARRWTDFMTRIAWCKVMLWFAFWTIAAITSAPGRRVAAHVVGTESLREDTTSKARERKDEC